jgi:large subunit ribosomal protein L21
VSYAVIVTGGKQFRVSPGSVVRVPSMQAEVGQTIEFDQVLAVNNDSEIKVGAPLVTGAVVKATVLKHGRGEKIIVFKFKRRKQYKRKQGHRQGFTAIRIESVV